jgi:hypothetical protein
MVILQYMQYWKFEFEALQLDEEHLQCWQKANREAEIEPGTLEHSDVRYQNENRRLQHISRTVVNKKLFPDALPLSAPSCSLQHYSNKSDIFNTIRTQESTHTLERPNFAFVVSFDFTVGL